MENESFHTMEKSFQTCLDKLSNLETNLIEHKSADEVAITKEIFDNYVDLINFSESRHLIKEFCIVLKRLKNILSNENIKYMSHSNEKIKGLHSEYNNLFNLKLNESAKFENGDNSALLLDHIQTLIVHNSAENKKFIEKKGRKIIKSINNEKLNSSIRSAIKSVSPSNYYDVVKSKIYSSSLDKKDKERLKHSISSKNLNLLR